MEKILLIAPKFNCAFIPRDSKMVELSFFREIRSFTAPLHLATIAGLTPDDIEVDIWDEMVQGDIDDSTDMNDYNLVGITSYLPDIPRAKEIAQIFRARRIPVVVGGAGVSSNPETCMDSFDVLFIGEAEQTWPQFLADWKTGTHQKVYRSTTYPDLSTVPSPRWDIVGERMKHYMSGPVQTTRGCPFDCEFCSVTVFHGHCPRHKSIDAVLEEVRILQRMEKRHVFFSDDNFTGDLAYSKSLLIELISLNKSFKEPLSFGTQASINLARDDKLLELLADAGFVNVFIGIESPNKESLRESNKFHNYHTNLIEDCRKIQSYGIGIIASMIVGFDHDDLDIFDQQFEFLQEACIPVSLIGILKARPGTRLWTRLLREGRLIRDDVSPAATTRDRLFTNIIPIMGRIPLLFGYLRLLERMLNWESFEERIKGFVSGVTRPPSIHQLEGQKLEEARTQFRKFFSSMDSEAQRAISNILPFTRDRCSSMLRRVLGLIFEQINQFRILESRCEVLREQIEFEKSLDIESLVYRNY